MLKLLIVNLITIILMVLFFFFHIKRNKIELTGENIAKLGISALIVLFFIFLISLDVIKKMNGF